MENFWQTLTEVFVPVVKGYSTIADATFRHNVLNLNKKELSSFPFMNMLVPTHMLTQLYNNSNWLMFMSEIKQLKNTVAYVT